MDMKGVWVRGRSADIVALLALPHYAAGGLPVADASTDVGDAEEIVKWLHSVVPSCTLRLVHKELCNNPSAYGGM